MKLKVFKKKIETILFKRNCDKKKYIIFYSDVQNNIVNLNSYNILNYSLKKIFHSNLSKLLTNNFLKSSFFSNINDFNFFVKGLKNNTNLIYFFKIKNLYFFNFNSDFKKSFEDININAFSFVLRLQKLFLGWIPSLKLVVKESSK